jgi:apolipoprotein N-acyltransferase
MYPYVICCKKLKWILLQFCDAWSFAAQVISVLILLLVGLYLSVLMLLVCGLKKGFWNNCFGFNLMNEISTGHFFPFSLRFRFECPVNYF